VFFMLLDGKFNGDSKKVLKIVIFSLQVHFTSNFVPDFQTVLKSCKLKVYKSFLAVFGTKRVAEIYDSYFDSGHVTSLNYKLFK